MPRGNSSPFSRRRFASARSSRCSTSFQSMKRQPAARCCGLSAFCAAAVCTNESSNCRSTDVLKSRLTRVEVGLRLPRRTRRRVWPPRCSHVRSVQRLCVRCEVPLDVAQFDEWPGVAHDAANFRRNVLWCKIQNQEPRYQLSVTRRASCVIQCVGE